MGPELTRIGNKAKPEWLAAWLANPRIYDATTPMPHYRFTPQQITTLTTYLQTKSDSDYGSGVHLDAANTKQIVHGRKLIVELGCAACHEINGVQKPENFAPDLSTIGSKPLAQIVFLPGMEHSLPSYIVAKIRQPRAFGSSVKMPQFALTASQTDALATALLALTNRSRSMPDSLRVAAVPETNYQPAGHAGKLITELACFSCHRINGRGGEMAPDLTWEGSSVQRQWLADFLHNPNTLRPSLIRRMPRFNLSDSDNKELTDYILTVYQSPSIDADSAPDDYERSGDGGARQAIVLFKICMPVVPHCRHQDRQGIHWADADAGWFAANLGVDLRVAQESSGTAPRHARTKSEPE